MQVEIVSAAGRYYEKKAPYFIAALILIFAGIAISIAVRAYFVNSLENDFQAYVEARPGLDLHYSGLRAQPLRQRIILKQARIAYQEKIEIRAGEITFADFQLQGPLPPRMFIRARDIEIVRLEPAREFIRELKLSGTKLSGLSAALEYEYLSEDNILNISRFVVAGPDQGLFCAELSLSGFNALHILAQDNPFLRAAAFLGIRINFFQAGYQDHGMLKRLAMPGEPGTQDKTPGPGGFLDRPMQDQEEDQVRAMLRGDKPLSVTISPKAPVPVSAILMSGSTGAAAEMLGLEVSSRIPDFCQKDW